MATFLHLQVTAPRLFALSAGKCACFAGIVAVLCCGNELLARPAFSEVLQNSRLFIFKNDSGYLAGSVVPQVVVAGPMQRNLITTIAPSYRSFVARLAAADDAASLGSDSGLLMASGEAASSGAVVQPTPLPVIATQPQGADVLDSDRIFRAHAVSESGEFAFPRPRRELRLFDELYLYFPVAGEETSEVSVIGGVLNGAVFAPPKSNNRSSNAIFSEVK
jgi:hypothetical protein